MVEPSEVDDVFRRLAHRSFFIASLNSFLLKNGIDIVR
jgi:hypothetical protein